jgi:hypothetical protein
MKAQNPTPAICIFTMLSSALAGVVENVSPNTGMQGCRVQLTDLVTYLKETAEIEGVATRVEHADNGATLNYPDFAQHMQCVNGTLHIDIKGAQSN